MDTSTAQSAELLVPPLTDYLSSAAKGLTSTTREYLGQALKAVSEGKRVLIVGSKGSNFGERLRLDPRFEFWDSTDPATVTRPLPTHIGAMLFLRFLPHNLHTRLCAEAAKLGFRPLVPIQSTGQARKLLGILSHVAERETVNLVLAAGVPLLPVEDPNVETVLSPLTPEVVPNRSRRAITDRARALKEGASKDFYQSVGGHVRLPVQPRRGEIIKEALRILPEVQIRYPHATVQTVRLAISALRRNAHKQIVKKAHPEPVAAKASTPIPEPVAVSPDAETPEALRKNEHGVAHWLSILAKACALFATAAPHLATLSEEFERLKAERDDYKDRLDSMTEALTRPAKTR